MVIARKYDTLAIDGGYGYCTTPIRLELGVIEEGVGGSGRNIRGALKLDRGCNSVKRIW